jgi:hypothetical protein
VGTDHFADPGKGGLILSLCNVGVIATSTR